MSREFRHQREKRKRNEKEMKTHFDIKDRNEENRGEEEDNQGVTEGVEKMQTTVGGCENF